MFDYIDAFTKDIQANLGPVDFTPVPDGAIHRERAPGDKSGCKSLWYVLFPGDCPGGAYGNWKTGDKYNWCSKAYPTKLDTADLIRRIAEARRQSELALKHRQKQAAERAQREWQNARPAWKDHSYLQRKQIPALGARQIDNYLVIPLANDQQKIVSLQKIYPDGNKLFLRGGQIQGCYSPIGHIDPEGRLYICEGWATGMTLYVVTGRPVACAMTANNLANIAKIMRARYPKIEIIIAGDDDKHTEGNPGRTSAEAAAMSIGATVTFPTGCCQQDCPCTDFNDVYCCNNQSKEAFCVQSDT